MQAANQKLLIYLAHLAPWRLILIRLARKLETKLAEGLSVHHEASHPALQHHFENMEQQREAGTLGMWVFLVTELMFFGGMFLAYTLYRTKFPPTSPLPATISISPWELSIPLFLF